MNKEIGLLVINNKDRLLRFGSELVFKICKWQSVEVIVVEGCENKTFEEELSPDVIELMTVFCAKLYGKRSHQNKRNKKESVLSSA